MLSRASSKRRSKIPLLRGVPLVFVPKFRDRRKRYQKDITNKYLEALAKLANTMEVKEYWELSVEEGLQEKIKLVPINLQNRPTWYKGKVYPKNKVRREKISERMKMFQALVPGCDKVTGKALLLDEIINYVQSLQNQVEFLSMKIASVNPMFYDFGIDLDAFMVKPEGVSSLEEPQQADDVPQCYSPNQSTTNTLNTTPNNYSLPLLDTCTLLLLQQDQMPNILSEFQVLLYASRF